MGGESTQNYTRRQPPLAAMEIQEALQWTDEFIFTKTGQHLDSLQRAILEGVWEHKGYKEIAEEYHCSNDHVRKSASELWKLLSEMLGKEVKKKNVRSLIENQLFSYYDDAVHIGNNINICNDLYNHPKKNDRPLAPANPLNRATTSVKHPNIRTSTTAPKNSLPSSNGYLQKIAASLP